MKIEVRNLGVITEAQIDLKPLTIFVGPNNAGKTWLAYTLAGIFGHYGWMRYVRAYVREEVSDTYPPIDIALQQILNDGSTKFDLVQFAEDFGELYINNVAKLAKKWMPDFMRSERISFDDLDVQVNISEEKERIVAQVLDQAWEREISGEKRKQLINALKESGKRELYIYTSSQGEISEKLPLRAIKEFLVMGVFAVLHHSFYLDVPIFPTERTAFITFPFNEVEESKTIEGPERTKKRRPLIEPVGYFLTMIRSAFLTGSLEKSAREGNAIDNFALKSYTELAQFLEQRILNGNIVFSTPEPDPGREILFRPNDHNSVEIPVASSMVKELSSLVLYLRHLSEPGDWLIIDEPEMNLHPEAQAQLTEFLAMLVNAGLRVLFTTHSPYIVDHLANLMKAAESSEPDAIKEKFYLQRKEAFISKDKVSVYLVDSGKTKDILDEDGVIHWDTFGNVSDKVSEIYFEI